MSNKPEHTTYFREIIRRLKEMEIEFRKTPKPNEEVYGEMGDKIELVELPFPPEMFDRLSSDEILLNINIPLSLYSIMHLIFQDINYKLYYFQLHFRRVPLLRWQT